MKRLGALFATAISAAVLLTGCGGDGDGRPAITVAAASDLRDALAGLKPRLESASGSHITFVFGSSGQLKQQVLAGAKYDLFLSADQAYVGELERAGRVTRSAGYAHGRLALTWREGLAPMDGPEDLTRTDVRRIAIANPDHAPYGRAAQDALAAAGLEPAVAGRLVLAENVRQALDYVEGGNADAGLVALALVIGGARPYKLVDASLHRPIVQAGGVVRGGHEEEAGAILDFLISVDGQAALREYGFEPVDLP